MRKILLFNILIFVYGLAHAQTLTSSENYIYTRTYLEPVTAENPTAKQVQSVQYFDGLGRVKQQVAIKATVNNKDLVVPSEYDPSGRQTKSYLPVPVSSLNGALQTTDGNTVNAYYGVANAYSETLLENSPLGRVLKQAHPGAEWQMNTNHTVKYEYTTNSGTEVKRLKAVTTWNAANLINDVSVNFAPDDSFTAGGYYKANTLIKKTTKDEDNKETQVFTNASGQVQLVRKVDGTGAVQYVDTYYVYDELGNLVLVIPPKAAFNTIAELNGHLNTLCYQYRYDRYNRLAEKRLPGKTYWESVVYDKQNRPVLSQDSNQKNKQWAFVKYDELGRIAYTGLWDSTASRVAVQTELNNMSSNALNNEARTAASFILNGINVYYTNDAFPTGNMTILSVNYYDDYPVSSPVVPATVLNQNTLSAVPVSSTSNGYTTSRSSKTLPTASYTKNIEDDNWSSSFIWYDRQGRSVGTYSKNHLGGYTRTETELDFSGAPKESFTYHKRLDTDTETMVKQRFVYDDQKRMKQQYHKVNGWSEELVAENTYNDLGQLIRKEVGNSLQGIDYSYDIRGRLTRINDPANLNGKLFGYEIKTAHPLTGTPQYNGNITEVDWKTATDNLQRRYEYLYDSLNRLKKGTYTEPYSSVPQNNFFNESVDYDPNGNITGLQRNGKNALNALALIDNLSYSYSGNQLSSVTDSSADYNGYPEVSGNTISYDDNGNMANHTDKGVLQVDYNILNLPKYIKFNQSVASRGGARYVNTSYTYRADGAKVRKIYQYKDGTNEFLASITTDYLDGFQYEANPTLANPMAGTVLKFIPTSEGYYDFEKNKYIYTYTDHLGNVRLSYFRNTNGSAEVLEENNYYPFGLKHQGYNAFAGNPAYKYQYNGKELQEETGWSDFGARMYMADIGRWGVIDPLAEQMRRHSPYNYAFNNPINFIDPDGMAPRQLTMASEDSPKDAGYSWTNPNWIGVGSGMDLGESYGFGTLTGGGGGSSPTFQFPKGQEEYYQKNYPAFYDFVKNVLPNMIGDEKFMKALSSASGFSMEELAESFKYGKGMYLKALDLTLGDAEYLYGGITESSTRNTTAIDTPVLDWFEKANRNPQSVEGLTNLMYMSALIAHETAHWGDDVKRTVKYDSTGLSTKYGDVGNFFENRAFGGGIGSYQNGISGSIKNYVQANFILLQSIFK
ncbi:DUF6443 domain-containing protein [Chryseobacterium camelliae]|uniref:DUF6443 domain-containing protein n=1 Tax=Chryseobacterium camelliae TaxID=1265445 RepID=A0ABY7QJQ6_9FLAO|nr:DUF6443 domain-containing protein [Chryseobacterium camelliae]WBV59928.1 DUF6443 domain-containing protein [Chryseobacterium camelliae]